MELPPVISNFPIKKLNRNLLKKIEFVIEDIEPEICVLEEKMDVLWQLYKTQPKGKNKTQLEDLLLEANKNILSMVQLNYPRTRGSPVAKEAKEKKRKDICIGTYGRNSGGSFKKRRNDQEYFF